MEKQPSKIFEDNEKYEVGDLVVLHNDWDRFGLGIVKNILTLDEILDIYNESVLNLALYTKDRIYTIYFYEGKTLRVFGREIKNAK